MSEIEPADSTEKASVSVESRCSSEGGGPITRPRRGTRKRWVTSRGTIESIASIDPQVAAAVFATPDAIALGGWPGATTGRAWGSCEDFEADVREGSIAPDVRVAMYDPERWAATPASEQRDPITSSERFVALAHERGFLAMVTPHPGLVEVEGGACVSRSGETREAAYVRCRIAEGTARNADAYETQAQRLQNDPVAYRGFVSATAEQARRANPNVLVLSGLSTHPGYAATPRMLYEAWDSVVGIVDGHYLSLAKLRLPEVATEFLRKVLAAQQ